MLKQLGLIGCAIAALGAQQGWYPHEGGLMKYRVNIRFGEEPKGTMPSGWKFGRVSRSPLIRPGMSTCFSAARTPIL